MAIRALSFDFDGCLFNLNYIQSTTKDIIKHNEALLGLIKTQNNDFSTVYTFVGSNRQSKKVDDDKDLNYKKGSCFPAITKICEHLGTIHDRFLLADIYGDLADGTSYDRAVQQDQENVEHADWIFDGTKLTILYAQMHKIAQAHQDDTIVFDFYDDRLDILSKLGAFFETHPELIPKNLVLHLNHYAGSEVDVIKDITGTGMIDTNYRQTVKDMSTIAIASSDQTDLERLDSGGIKATEYVQPHLLLNRRLLNPRPTNDALFRAALDAVKEKANALKADGHKDAADMALTLYTKIDACYKEYVEKKIAWPAFRDACAEAIKLARPELEKHRTWGFHRISGDLYQAIAKLRTLIGYAAEGLHNLSISGSFTFFRPKTDAAQKLIALETAIDQFAPPAA